MAIMTRTVTWEDIEKKTLWVGKFYGAGRIVGTYEELESMQDDFRDMDICANQPEELKEFYEGYFSQNEYYLLKDYYDNVYAKSQVAV